MTPEPAKIRLALYDGAKLANHKATVYIADEQGIDVGNNKYAVVCEYHHTCTGANTLELARQAMVSTDFCEDCQSE